MRNNRISKKRSPVERFYAFIKRVCKAGHVAVTTTPRVRVKMIITGIVFNVSFGIGQEQIGGIALAVEKYGKNNENKGFRRQEQRKLERKRQNIDGFRYGNH